MGNVQQCTEQCNIFTSCLGERPLAQLMNYCQNVNASVILGHELKNELQLCRCSEEDCLHRH